MVRSARMLLLGAALAFAIATTNQSNGKNSTHLARHAQEDDIRETVIRYQMDEWVRDGDKNEQDAKDPKDKEIAKQLNSQIFFVSVNGKDPTDEFLKRLQSVPRVIKKQSRAQQKHEVTDKDTHTKGIIFRVDKIRWTSDTEVEVEGGYDCGSLGAVGNLFTLRNEGGKWKVGHVRTKWNS